MVLSLDPARAGMAPTPELPHVWGVAMEIGADQGWASLVTLADGTTSLYTSGGGGVIGGGAHEPVVEASARLLRLIDAKLALFEQTEDLDPPGPDQTRFLALTYDGIRSRSAPTEQLASGDDELAHIFAAGNDLLTQLRLAANQR
jgi:hypothetical protein